MLGITDEDQIQYVMDAAEQFACWNDPEYAHIGSPLMVFADASRSWPRWPTNWCRSG